MSQQTPMVIRGDIHLVGMTSTIQNATIYIQLRDVSLADAPSTVIAENVMDNVTIDITRPHPVPFSMQSVELEAFAMYTLTVHIDVSRTGAITAGDYITMESYPVLPSGGPSHINVNVHPV